MTIITISRRPFSRGRDVAEEVARRLGYGCIAREVLFETARKFDLRDREILRAIHDAPSFSDHFHYGRERYVAFYQAALLEVLRRDNTVYHGLAGHFFIQGVSHGLKVRVITGLEERVRVLTAREGIDPKSAARIIAREDRERRKWSRHLYGIDTWDPGLYNLVLNIEEIAVGEAAEIICHAAGLDRFRTTPESQARLDDMVLAARVKAALIQVKPDIEVSARHGRVLVRTAAPESRDAEWQRKLEEAARAEPEVEEVEIRIDHSVRHYD